MTARVIDFDAFRAEQEAREGKVEPPTIKIGGEVYSLPPDLPAIVAVDVIRLNKDRGAAAQVDPVILMSIGSALFGDETFRRILVEQKMGVRDMGTLIMQVFRVYDPTEGKETVPNRQTRRAVKRSTSSKTGR